MAPRKRKIADENEAAAASAAAALNAAYVGILLSNKHCADGLIDWFVVVDVRT